MTRAQVAPVFVDRRTAAEMLMISVDKLFHLAREIPVEAKQIHETHASAPHHNRRDGGRLRSESQTEAVQ